MTQSQHYLHQHIGTFECVRIYLRMYIRTCVVFVCTYVCMCLYVHANVCGCMYVCLLVCVRMYMYVRIHTPMHTYVRICMYSMHNIRMYVCTYV